MKINHVSKPVSDAVCKRRAQSTADAGDEACRTDGLGSPPTRLKNANNANSNAMLQHYSRDRRDNQTIHKLTATTWTTN